MDNQGLERRQMRVVVVAKCQKLQRVGQVSYREGPAYRLPPAANKSVKARAYTLDVKVLGKTRTTQYLKIVQASPIATIVTATVRWRKRIPRASQ